MLEAGLSCLPWGCTCLVLKLCFLRDACVLDKLFSKSLWHPGKSNAVVFTHRAAVSRRQRGTLEELCGSVTLHRACFSSCPWACAPHWFGNCAGSVLLSVCMLAPGSTGENEQEQCREPESQGSKVGDPGCTGPVSGFNDVLGFSSSAVVMFLVEEVQRNIFDQRCVENELWNR